uniref:Chromo domain-containing protein n=1 Tax=Clastoptera arizonana TaxID=38151 RepID=A0A1B6CNB6_9HEMI
MDPKDSQSEFTEDDDSHWFDKNINLGQSVSSLTESTDHDELSRDFTQDELNLVHSDDHSEPTNNEDLITDKLDEHDDLKSEQNNLTPETDLNLELPEDSPPQKGSTSDEELENELLEGSSLSLESKKDDITKELTDIFFQTQDKTQFSSELSEDNNKDALTDILDKDEPTAFSSELIEDINKDTLPDILHEDEQKDSESLVRNDGDIGETIKNELSKIIDDVDLNPELESKTMDVVQELQEHIKLVGSHQGTEDLDGQDKVLNTICIGTKDIEEELEESRVNKNVVHESTEDDLSHESNSMSLDKVPVISKIDDELIKEPAMVEFIHDSENSVKININTENNHSKFVVSDVKSGLNAETIVMETDEGEQIVFNAEVIATESNSTTLNVEGGAEFLEAVTGSLDELLETEDEPIPEPAMRRKKEPLKCFVSSCKSGKSGTRTSFRYFKPPESVLKKWQTILTQDGEELTTESTVCELHFKSGHIFKKGVDASGTVIWGLREGALPTVHNAAMPKPTSKTVSVPKVTKAPETTFSTLTVNKNAAVVSSKVLSPQRKSPKFTPKPLRPSPRQAEMNDPDFLVKNPELLKTAQDELLSLDVLVCGDCRSVFHFVKDFSHHKENLCNGKSTFKANISESKAQVWAFLLWKSAQAKLLTDVESPWKLYQRWCKMDDNVREAWTTAGNSLMDLTSLGHSKLSDGSLNKTSYVPARPGRPPSNRHEEEEDDGRNSNIIMKKVKRLKRPSEGGAGDGPAAELEEEPMETEDDPSSGKVEEQERESAEQNQSQNDNLPEDIQIKEEVMSEEEEEEDIEDEEDIKESENVRDRLRERRHMPEYKNKVVPKQDKKIVSKSNDDSQDEEEFVVEKIVSRRYNSKKKQFEYLLKWEGYPSEQNTWEPAENMATCQHLLKAFEATLVKQHTAKQGGLTPGRPPISAKKRVETFAAGPSGITSQGRPDRRSKQKALDQVKAWCGTIKPTEEDYGLKRKIESDSDFDEDDLVPSKKLKGDSEDDIRSPKKFVRVGQRFGRPEGKLKPSVNGYKKESNLAAALGLESDSENDSERANVASPSPEKSHPVVRKMSSLSVQNQKVLVANAKGVVKVDPSHVPNLTSGVYIMSNTKGILKVDNTALSTSLQNQASIKKSPGIDVSSTSTSKTENSSTPQKSGIIRRPAGILGGVGGTLPRGPINTPLRPQGLLRSTRPGFSPRPSGIVRSSIATPSPRPLGIPSGITTKIQGAVRPKGSLPLGQSAVSPKSPSLQPKTTILQKTPPLPTTKTSPLKPSPLQPTVVQPKATTPLPKVGALQKPPLTPKPPQKPPLKPTLKPIESILGVGFQQVKEKNDFSEFVSMNPQKSPFHSTSPEFKFPVPVRTYYKVSGGLYE